MSPDKQRAFAWAFLPAVSRTVRPSGVHLQHIRYWHPVFAQWAVARRAVLVHFDPRDLRRVYVRADDATFLEVPCAELDRPAVSLWEVQAAARHLRTLGDRAIGEERLFAAIERQRDIVRRAAAKTRKARALHARLHERSRRGVTAEPATTAGLATAPVAQEEAPQEAAVDTADYGGEIWPSRSC